MNLIFDKWIPTDSGLIGLNCWHGVNEITAPPMTRLAIVRLMQAIRAWENREEANSINDYADWFDLKTAFQVKGLPESSARSAYDIINMSDGNGVAWSPLPAREQTDVDLALALVTAYFCDRGGLKARVEGLPISGQTPLHVGQRVKLKRGNTLCDLIDNNPAKYESDYQPPWVTGLIFPEHKTPRDEMELLLWPWRRLQVFDNGITVAPGAPIDKGATDPWSIEKASLKHLSIPAEKGYEVTALVMNQAMPVACWVN